MICASRFTAPLVQSPFAKLISNLVRGFAALLVALPATVNAQAGIKAMLQPDDLGGVLVTVVVPARTVSDARSQDLLITRLVQVASSGGLSGVSMRTRFVMFPRVVVLEAVKTEGLQKLVTATVEVAIEVQDNVTGVPLHQFTATVAGTAADEPAAVMQAINSLRPTDVVLRKFATETHDRIVQFYEANCQTIRTLAKGKATAGARSESLATLLSVPRDAEKCYASAMTDATAIVASATIKSTPKSTTPSPDVPPAAKARELAVAFFNSTAAKTTSIKSTAKGAK